MGFTWTGLQTLRLPRSPAAHARGPRASCQRRHPGANPAAPQRGLVPGMILDERSRALAWAEPQLRPLPHRACSDLPERASAVASVAVAADVEAASTASSLRRLARQQDRITVPPGPLGVRLSAFSPEKAGRSHAALSLPDVNGRKLSC